MTPFRWRGVAAGVFACGAIVAAIGVAEHAIQTPDASPVARRVLIVTMPGLTWEGITRSEMPALDAFVDSAAVADVNTRRGRPQSDLTDAYVTIGAGSRAQGSPGGEVDAPAAASAREQRLGPLVQLGVRRLIEENAHADFGAVPGRFGSELARIGARTAVIANDDGVAPENASSDGRSRPALNALMDRSGRVHSGAIGPRILRGSARCPDDVGQRELDIDTVDRVFRGSWNQARSRSVLLVEASDLVRAASRPAAPASAAMSAARTRSDALLARLLRSVDFERDVVAVIGLPVSSRDLPLSPIAIRAPGWSPGLLGSSSTRRAGFVTLADVAPTVLGELGARPPTDIEGRAASVSKTDTSPGERRQFLRWGIAAAAQRDQLMPFITGTLVASVVVLIALRRRRSTRLARWTALATLAFGPATYLARGVGSAATNLGAFLGVVAALVALLVVAVNALTRAQPTRAALVAVATIPAVIGFDVISGAHLQINSVFGYSLLVGGRFAGLGNLAFALFASAAFLLAVGVATAFPGVIGLRLAVVLLIVTVLVDGLPYLGADVGGVLAMVPAFGLGARALMGSRIGAAHVAGWLLGGVAVVVGFGFLDLARPAHQRTHLARLAEQVRSGGPSRFVSVMSRRFESNFGFTRGGVIVVAMFLTAGLAGLVAIRRRRDPQRSFQPTRSGPVRSGSVRSGPVRSGPVRSGPVRSGPVRSGPVRSGSVRSGSVRSGSMQHSTRRAVVVGLGVLAALGLLTNDSSVAVPGLMLTVLVPVLIIDPGFLTRSPSPAQASAAQ